MQLLPVLLLLPWGFPLLAGEEALEVGEAFFVLWGLRPLARQLHLHRGRDRVAQAHPLQAFHLRQSPIKFVLGVCGRSLGIDEFGDS